MGKILVIDGDAALTEALSVRLRAAGYDVIATDRAEHATRLAVSERPDLILMDLDLDGFSGLDIHECLKFSTRTRAIPVVYLSGSASVTDRAMSFHQGAAAFICKPYTSALLLDTIRAALAQRNVALANA